MGLTVAKPIGQIFSDPTVAEHQSLLRGSRWTKIAYLVAFVLLVCVRMPNVILHGRFWAEEGTVFFSFAHSTPWTEAIFHSYAGYTNLVANLAGILANQVPLIYAPYMPTGLALIIQTIPAAVLCLSSSEWLSNKKVLLVALGLILVQPVSQEIWLSSIGSQCFLALSVGIILGLSTEVGRIAIFQQAVLFFSALSSPGASVFLPAFVLRSVVERSGARARQSLALALGTGIQFFFWYHASDRAMNMDLQLFLTVAFEKHLMVPFLGRVQSMGYANYLYQLALSGRFSIWPILGTLLAFAVMALVVCRQPKQSMKWFFAGGLILTLGAFFGALGNRAMMLDVDAGNRYTYAPQVLFELSLLVLSVQSTGLTRKIAGWMVVWLMIVGMHEYFWSAPVIANGADWSQEVHAWQKDHSHPLAIWPVGWQLQL